MQGPRGGSSMTFRGYKRAIVENGDNNVYLKGLWR